MLLTNLQAPVEDANSITNRLRALVSGGEGKTPTQQIMRSKLILLGEGRVGKTATSKSLLWQPFDHGEKSTIGCSSRDARLDAQTAQGWEKVGAGRELNRVLAAALRADNSARQAGISVDRALRTKGLKQRRDDEGEDQPRRQRLRSMHGSKVQHRKPHGDDDDEGEGEEEEEGDDDDDKERKNGKGSVSNGSEGAGGKDGSNNKGSASANGRNNNNNTNTNNGDNDDDLDDDENFGLKQLLDKVQLSLQQEPGASGDSSQHILYSMWDFAGQSVFYDLLHILMTR